MNRIDLEHRYAIVTGAAQGIGLAIAKRLLACGAAVSLWDRDAELLSQAETQLKTAGPVSKEVANVSDASSVAAATASTIARFGTIDILVANAGIAGPNHKTWEYPIDAWKQIMDVNLNGVFYC